MKKRLIIHIGQDKAGSTSLQTFLSAHKHDLLRNHGIYYVNDEGGNSAYLGSAFNAKPLEYVHNIQRGVTDISQIKAEGEGSLSRLQKDLNKNQDILETIVLSYEGFYFSSVAWDNLFNFFSSWCNSFDLVFFYRNPVSYVISAIAQQSVTGELDSVETFLDPGADFPLIAHPISLPHLVGQFKNINTRCNLSIQLMHSKRIKRQNIVDDFKRLLGVDHPISLRNPIHDLNKSANLSEAILAASIKNEAANAGHIIPSSVFLPRFNGLKRKYCNPKCCNIKLPGFRIEFLTRKTLDMLSICPDYSHFAGPIVQEIRDRQDFFSQDAGYIEKANELILIHEQNAKSLLPDFLSG